MAPVYTIDTHTHAIPDFYKEALIKSGYAERKEGDPTGAYVDRFRMPDFTIESYLENRARWGYDYSVLSVTAPGVSFLKGAPEAKQLARRVNEQLFEWSQQYPKSLGAFACLPLPDVQAAIEEARYSLDELKLEGIGMYSNYGGIYLGDPFLDPLFEELNARKATVFVHPVAPIPEPQILDTISSPVIEYTFDTTRTIASILFTNWRKRFPDVKMIFSHGGGVLPYLASRLALQTTYEFQGGWDYDESLEVLKTFYFDLAVSTSAPQIAALTSLVGTERLLFATDYPYYPERLLKLQEDGFNKWGFSLEDVKKVRSENALAVLPRIKEKVQQQ